MALMTTASSGLTPQYQKYFAKKLLKYKKQLTVLDQFAQKVPFPKNEGAVTIRFMRPNVGDAAQVLTLSEGVVPTTYREITWTAVDATLAQYGQISKISDVVKMTDLFSTMEQAVRTQAEDSSLHADKLMRDVIIAGVTTAPNKRYSQGLASWAALAAATNANGSAKIVDVLDAMTTLDIQRAPLLNGDYVMIASPQIIRDMMNDTKFFVPAATYGNVTKALLKGEVGTWFGVKIVKNTVPWVEDSADAASEGTYDDTGTQANRIYASIITGEGSFGAPFMSGNSPFDPSVRIIDKPDSNNPLGQYVMVGWKSFWATLMLNADWAVVLRSKTEYA